MSDSYVKSIVLLPTQTQNFVEGPNSQDTVTWTNLNYFASLFESEITFDMVVTFAAGALQTVPAIFHAKKGPF
jgi:hypothetical protein